MSIFNSTSEAPGVCLGAPGWVFFRLFYHVRPKQQHRNHPLILQPLHSHPIFCLLPSFPDFYCTTNGESGIAACRQWTGLKAEQDFFSPLPHEWNINLKWQDLPCYHCIFLFYFSLSLRTSLDMIFHSELPHLSVDLISPRILKHKNKPQINPNAFQVSPSTILLPARKTRAGLEPSSRDLCEEGD